MLNQNGENDGNSIDQSDICIPPNIIQKLFIVLYATTTNTVFLIFWCNICKGYSINKEL